MPMPFAYLWLWLANMAVFIHVGYMGYAPFSSDADASVWICTDKRVDAEDFITSCTLQMGFISD